MVESPIDQPVSVLDVLRPYLAPALRHAGWFAFFLFLAPCVGPRGYGLFLVAFAGIAIAGALLRQTATRLLVGFPALEERHWSTAFVVLIAVGTVASLVPYGLVVWFGLGLDDDRVGDLIRSLAIVPFLDALAVVPSAALQRESRHAALTAAEIAGLAAGGGIAVSLAIAGAGPWSLVAQVIVQRLIECVVLWGLPGERIGLAWSRRHWRGLASSIDWGDTTGAVPAVMCYGSCLIVGWSLGPTAAGLYMIAGWLAEALIDCALVAAPGSPDEVVRRACRLALPATLASLQLTIALPAILDLRWWGAVVPCQILLLGAVPAGLLRASSDARRSLSWAWYALGGLAAVALASPRGLTAVALAEVGWAGIAGLGVLRSTVARQPGTKLHLSTEAMRPLLSAAAAGLLLLALVDPIAERLPALSALCLLTALGWLVYLVVRGEAVGVVQPLPPVPLNGVKADR
jgi:hypothetical protein